MSIAKSFRDLNVYKLSRAAAGEIYQLSKNWPKEERYALTDQIRRSSRAVKAMVAEAWARRRYIAAFSNKIDEALGEAMETQSWLDDAVDYNYITQEQFSSLDANYQSIGAMLTRMMDRGAGFCKPAAERGRGEQ